MHYIAICLNIVPDGPVWDWTTTNQDDYSIPQFDNVTDQSYQFSLGIINCCSVCNKCPQLDFIIGTESHLDSSVLNAEVFPFHYSVYRWDRNRYGGCVFILAKYNIPSSLLQSFSSVELI